MKNLVLSAAALLALAGSSQASVLFYDSFDSYSNGNLVGQGLWAQTGTATNAPVQVNSGRVAVASTGQDVYAPLFGAPFTIGDGTSLYIGLSLNVAAAQAAGDYFLHYTPSLGNSSIFLDRLYVKSSGSGYLLGWLAAGPNSAAPTYGTTELSFSTDYRIVLAYNAVAGTVNDTGAIYVNPAADGTDESNDVAYLTSAYNSPSTTAENANVAALNLRQGSSANAATLTVDDLTAATSFAEVTPAPEPSALSLLLGGTLLTLFLRRR